MNKKDKENIIAGIRKYSDHVESDIDDFLYYEKRDKGVPHKKLSSCSRIWQDAWIAPSIEGDPSFDIVDWVMDIKTWYTYRKCRSGKMLNMEHLVPCYMERAGNKVLVRIEMSGPKKWFDKNRKKWLKMREDTTLSIPIKEIVLVKR